MHVNGDLLNNLFRIILVMAGKTIGKALAPQLEYDRPNQSESLLNFNYLYLGMSATLSAFF